MSQLLRVDKLARPIAFALPAAFVNAAVCAALRAAVLMSDGAEARPFCFGGAILRLICAEGSSLYHWRSDDVKISTVKD